MDKSVKESPVTLRQLRYFIAVAENRGFRAAAERLHITQPPLTKQIQLLEDAMGVRLLDRGRRGITLTASGASLIEDARRILAAVSDSYSHTRAVGLGLAGQVRFGMVDDVVAGPIMRGLFNFAVNHPDVRIETQTGFTQTLLEGLTRGSLDLVIANRPLPEISIPISRYPLGATRIVVLAHDSHIPARTKAMPVSELAEQPLILPPTSSQLPFAVQCRHIFDAVDLKPRVVHYTSSTEIAINLATLGHGCALISEHALAKLPSNKTVKTIRIDSEHAWLEQVLVHPEFGVSATSQNLMEELLRVVPGRASL